ncbi:MAG: 4-carboxy-4-hydroxy-2-oxoadipate aldolase/oxaloacetate decarboxylase [Spirochaetales bacterium]|nr:MAG: 4-carboxy-4-hydroxy-2-oxoadipate aldolase/oxaloacetate decarboxylase [Spirochaetales bacterium]
MVHVFTHIQRPDRKVMDAFKDLGTATVYEASGRRGSVDPGIKPLARGIRLLGPAVTIECHPRDNLMLHKALQIAEKGDVLVVSTQGYPEAGYWGGLMAGSAVARQLGGLAIDGCVRDSTEIIEMAFPVFCRGTCIRGTTKGILGKINHPLLFGEVVVNPGDLIIGDDDGLVIVAREDIEAVLKASQERITKEVKKASELAGGVSSVELNKLGPIFQSLGMVEE